MFVAGANLRKSPALAHFIWVDKNFPFVAHYSHFSWLIEICFDCKAAII
jgi:hypothetical protein